MGLVGELYNESLIALRLRTFYLLESSSELEFSQIKSPLMNQEAFVVAGTGLEPVTFGL